MKSRPAAFLSIILFLVMNLSSTLFAELPSIEVQDINGKTVSLQSLAGEKPVMLVFWATWCGHCRREIPKIKEARRKFADTDLKILAIDPGVRDSLTSVQRFAKTFDLNYPVFFDAHQQSRISFSLKGTPTIILINREGREISRSDAVDFDAIEKLLNR